MDPRSFPGCKNWEFAHILWCEAQDKKGFVMGDFNGTPMLAHPRITQQEMLQNWAEVRAEQQRARYSP
jgi:hypothetical protein